MNLILLIWALVALIGHVNCKCSLAPIVDDQRSIAYACIHGDLHDLDEISSETEWIEFSVSHLQTIPDNAFWRFKNLRRLSFYNCHVNAISPDAFRGLNQLNWLIFYGTRIHVARAAWFRYLPNLKRLILDRCGLVHVEPDVFHMLPKLETLGLRDNDLDCLPIDELESLRMLKTVRIDGNPWLCDCRQRLEKFFQEKLVFQDEEECMKKLGVYRNLQCMTDIELPILPTSLTMEELRIFEQKLTRFRLNKFETAVLTSLDRLPDKTSWIEIVGLKIDELPQYTFFRFGNSLRSLDFRDCIITIIEPNAFVGLHKLERLSLIGNRLPVIEASWFRDLVNLQQLILERNEIKHIQRTAFWPLKDSLRHLNIRNNQLRCLFMDDIAELKKLERLDAFYNPWTCTCRRNLERILIEKNVGFEISVGRCSENEDELPQTTVRWHPSQTSTVATSVTGNVHWGSFQSSLNQTNIIRLKPTVPTSPSIIETSSSPPVREGTCILDQGDHSRQIYTCSALTSMTQLATIPYSAHTIRIILSNIPTIPSGSFARFNGYLRRLEFRDCGVKNIEQGAFAGLHNLEYLSLHSNDLQSITLEYFESLVNLRYLDLSGNRIFRITNNVFDGLPYLISIDISDNLMNCIGIEHIAHRLEYLRNFKITDNPWSCLCGTKLIRFLEERNLPYDKNAMLNLSEECYNTRRPPVLTDVTTIRPIDTSQISTIAIPTINETIEGICTTHQEAMTLRYVCSGGNLLLLKTIPDYVTAIEFHEGHLPHLPSGTFSRFHNLKELIIRNCGLRTIETGAFDGLQELKELTIQDNPLVTIGKSWFPLENLERLDLRGNSLRYIVPGAFQDLTRLNYLNLEGNDLKCIFTSDLNDMPNVHIIEFSGNPLKWRCRVELEQFLEMRKIKFVKIEESCEGKKLMRILLQNRTSFHEDYCRINCSTGNRNERCLLILITLLCFCTLWN